MFHGLAERSDGGPRVFPLIAPTSRHYRSSICLIRVKASFRCDTAEMRIRRCYNDVPPESAFMKSLPDPRRYQPFSSNPLVLLAGQAVAEGSALQHGKARAQLPDAVASALRDGDDALIEQALGQATSRPVLRMLIDTLDAVLQGSGDGALLLRVFAIPILLVTGGRGPLVLPGVIADAQALRKLFETHGTLGPMKNFGLSGTLVSAQGLASVKPGPLYRRIRSGGGQDFAPLDLPPAEILIADSDEEVHLRFLTGVTVTPADAPDFTETAGDIGAWGMPFSGALAAQLGQPGLSLLAIPRQPMSLLRALEAGAFAASELGFQLFLSNALRGFRSRVGEAQAAVCACADDSVRIRLSSPFDPSPPK
jgi:hypothetical protein